MNTQKRKTIELALQGGGAHGAFTWGVLDRLLEDGRLHAEVFDPFHGMMSLGGIDAGISNRHLIPEHAADPDGIAVNHPDDLDGGRVTLGCDKTREQDEKSSNRRQPDHSRPISSGLSPSRTHAVLVPATRVGTSPRRAASHSAFVK